MPRRRRRFAALERQFRESGGTAAPGSRLAGYIDFKKGVNKIKVEKKLTGEQRKRYAFAILPFGVSPPANPTAADRYAAPITKYSNDARGSLGLTNAEMGYENVEEATKRNDNFYPAVMKVFVANGQTASPTSGITKKEYERQLGANYSFPFGRVLSGTKDKETGTTENALADVDEEDVKAKLSTKVKAVPLQSPSKIGSVTFLPEEFKAGRPDLASPP